jgi:hypothetical protein
MALVDLLAERQSFVSTEKSPEIISKMLSELPSLENKSLLAVTTVLGNQVRKRMCCTHQSPCRSFPAKLGGC